MATAWASPGRWSGTIRVMRAAGCRGPSLGCVTQLVARPTHRVTSPAAHWLQVHGDGWCVTAHTSPSWCLLQLALGQQPHLSQAPALGGGGGLEVRRSPASSGQGEAQ